MSILDLSTIEVVNSQKFGGLQISMAWGVWQLSLTKSFFSAVAWGVFVGNYTYINQHITIIYCL